MSSILTVSNAFEKSRYAAMVLFFKLIIKKHDQEIQ